MLAPVTFYLVRHNSLLTQRSFVPIEDCEKETFSSGLIAAVDVVMRFIVLPLSVMHARGPYQYHDLVLGLVVHMVLVGLPISFSVQQFGEVTEPADHQPIVN